MMNTKRQRAIVALTATTLISSASFAMASSHREAPGITGSSKVDATDFYMFRSYEPGREGFVTLIANYQPLQAPYGGPSYFTMDENAFYEIHIDNDGDAVEDITFQFKFDNDLAMDGAGIPLTIGGVSVPIPLRQAGAITADDQGALNETESYTVTMISGDRRSGSRAAVTGDDGATFTKPVDYIGMKTLPDYEDYVQDYISDADFPGCDGGGRVFVGQRAEAFAVNLGEIFDLINLVPLEGAIEQDRANDDLVGRFNVTSLALEVPISCLVGDGNGVIGGWTSSSLPQAQLRDPTPTYEQVSVFGGALVQQSRLSAPLVNEVVIGLPDKDRFNASEPMNDADPDDGFGTYVTNPTLPALVEILFGDALVGADDDIDSDDDVAPDNLPRTDLVAAFLTGFPGLNQQATVTPSEMMRLNTAVPATARADQNSLGVVAEDLAGFPNGRRPGDDTVDIALRVVMGALCNPVPLGAELGVDGAVEDEDSDLINLGYCTPEQAQAGNLPFTDGAPISAAELGNAFPYLNTPIPGSPNN